MNYFSFLLLLTCRESSTNNELLLRNDLFKNYSSNIRPVINDSLPINVEMGIGIKNLEEFNQKIESIKLNIWLRMNWNNEYLKWNESDYNVNFLSIDQSEVWIPDVELLNAGSLPEIYTLKGGMNLYSSGDTMYSRPGIFKFSCPLKLQDFPFDTQKCEMTFSSWVYSKKYLTLKPYSDSSKTIDILSTFSHSEWDIIDVTYKSEIIIDDSINKDAITFTISLKRFSHYYALSIGMTMTLVYVSFIIMLVSPDNLSRTGTAVFIPLTILALQLTIADKIPVVGYYTLMDKFFLACFVSSMFVSMESGIIYILMVTNSRPFFNFMKKYIDIQKYKNNKKKKENMVELANVLEENTNNETKTDLDNVYKTINYDNSYLNLSEDQKICKKIIKKYVVKIDNFFRVACILVYSTYVGALIGEKN